MLSEPTPELASSLDLVSAFSGRNSLKAHLTWIDQHGSSLGLGIWTGSRHVTQGFLLSAWGSIRLPCLCKWILSLFHFPYSVTSLHLGKPLGGEGKRKKKMEVVMANELQRGKHL